MILGNLFNKGKGGKVNPPRPTGVKSAGIKGVLHNAITHPRTAAGQQAGPKLVRSTPPSTPSRTAIAGVKHTGPRLHIPASSFSAVSNPSPGQGLKSALGLKGVREVPSQLDVTKISSVIDFAQAGFGRYDAVSAGTGDGGAIILSIGAITRIPIIANRVTLGLDFPDIIPNFRPNMGAMEPNIPAYADSNNQPFETRLQSLSVRVENSGLSPLVGGGPDGDFRWQSFGLSLLLYPANLDLALPRPRPGRVGVYRTWLRDPGAPVVTWATGISSAGFKPIYDCFKDGSVVYEWNLEGGTAWEPFSQTFLYGTDDQGTKPLTRRKDAIGPGQLYIPAGYRLDLEIDTIGIVDDNGGDARLLLDWNATAIQVGKNAQLPK
mgnify:FL=1